METTLAAREDAATILKLYELRQEPVLRRARTWMGDEFWPTSAEEIRVVINDFGSETNCWFRQVTGYWEMAAALVNHGILAQELFVDANSEPFFLAAKFWPYLQEIRTQSPTFLMQLEKLMERSASGRQKFEYMQASTKRRMAARRAAPMPEVQRPD
ncbi:MAG TPA: hypothetical protein VGM02_01350 [Acidobacteriaceae bacterium]|jgi:hypothetical protein